MIISLLYICIYFIYFFIMGDNSESVLFTGAMHYSLYTVQASDLLHFKGQLCQKGRIPGCNATFSIVQV